MSVSLRELVEETEFKLRVLHAADDSALERAVVWAHSSDLVDPTPWLEAGQLLLTDGMQFAVPEAPEMAEAPGPGAAVDAPAAGSRSPVSRSPVSATATVRFQSLASEGVFDAYVARLRAADVAALGFATEVIHAEVPADLVSACRRHGLTLVEVTERTPFIGIIRYLADQRALEQRARLEWSLQAQRKLARAALRPGGLGAILVELERQLESWVALYDSTGLRVDAPTRIRVPESEAPEVERMVQSLLARGGRSGARLHGDGGDVTLQTVGQHGQLRGVLAVGGRAPLDLAGNDLVASAIGHASIALEQNRELDAARGHLRVGLLELLLAGEMEVARRTAETVWGELPAAPVRVVQARGGEPGQALLDRLERLAGSGSEPLFFAAREQELIAIVPAGGGATLVEALADAGFSAGASAPGDWAELPRLLAEARKAAERSTPSRPSVWFEDLATTGMLGALEAADGRVTARRVLQPLLEHGEQGRLLLDTLAAWTEGNCAWDPVAKSLGIHRHTLRSRVTAAEQLLGIDLQTFAGRAEVWSAMRLLDEA
ncbi:helix-turn-helix domain-containing protein [Pseudoclavibacter terrae]|nr:PucR family transcriptional regulator ligand-binding domain-containing protein [Pseudoclavibacter terrae]